MSLNHFIASSSRFLASHSYNRAFQESLQQDPYASCVELGLATDGVVSDLRQRQQQQELAAQNMLSQSQILSAEMWIKSTHSNLEPFTDLQYDYRDFQARSEERTITFLQHQYARQDAVCHFNNIFKSCQCNPQEPQCIASKNSLFEDMCLGYRAQSTLPCLNRPLKRALANRIRNACTAQATDSGSRTFDFRLQNPARKSLCGVNLTDSGRSMPSIADILKVPSSKMDSGTYSTDTLRPQIPVQSDQKIPLHGTRPSSDQT